jgi:hypothetical protein
VPEERPLSQVSPFSNLSYCGLLEAALDIQFHGRPLKSAACIWSPAPHLHSLPDDSHRHQVYAQYVSD